MTFWAEPPRLVVPAARWKLSLFLAVLVAGLIGLVAVMITGRDIAGREVDPTQFAILGVCALGMGAASVFMARWIVRPPDLILDSEGFLISGVGGLVPWRDVDHFHVIGAGAWWWPRLLKVGWSGLANPTYRLFRRRETEAGRAEHVLGNVWTRNPAELVALLEEWRLRYNDSIAAS